MDDATAFAIEELKLQLAGLRTHLEHTNGRALALQGALGAALRSWGKPAAEAEAEISRVLELGSVEMAKQGESPHFLVEFESVEDMLIGSIHGAAQDDAAR
ncbi:MULTISPECIES: hypothetical protein [unclassified Stenotrophomonas]|uniref:hypothetical protein n=1 Tax=unclassified Stenotrophomonas TaxID=196198 RepID=UPI0019B8FD75|nr:MULTISPECIES: hypothetical protein [unclassified Stenotrophomonas]MBD3825624.1 hypothetical protein [Stenotrophomonas sp.]